MLQFNLITLCVLAVILSVTKIVSALESQQTSSSSSSSSSSTSSSSSSSPSSLAKEIETTTLPPPLPTAEKLVRWRRYPPPPSLRQHYHVTRSSKKRRPKRPKRPKFKYGPPSYSYNEPVSSYHRQQPPTISFEEFQNIHLGPADFSLPPSSYEAQSMDLDLYSHGGGDFELPKATISDFNFNADSFLNSKMPRKPHQKYGVPKEYETPVSWSTDTDSTHFPSFDAIPETPAVEPSYSPPFVSSDDFSSFIATAPSYEPPPSFPPEEEYKPPTPPRRPATKYGVPPPESYVPPRSPSYSKYLPSKPDDNYSPPSEGFSPPDQSFTQYRPTKLEDSPPSSDFADFQPPPSENFSEYQPTQEQEYSIYDKKIPNAIFTSHSGHYSFAEPPAAPPSDNVEITISPSYEIKLPDAGSDYQPSSPPANPHAGNFAEPPAPPPPAGDFAEPPAPPPPASYQPPAAQPPPASYQPPAAHPPPTSYQPPASYQPPVEQPPPTSYQPPAKPPPTSYQPPAQPPPPPASQPPSQNPPSQKVPDDDYVPPSQELPLNPNPKQPTYDFPKSSYEVPIYDPIPFEASNHEEQQEFYPPHGYDLDHSLELDHNIDEHSSGTSKTSITTEDGPPRRRRTNKRKRLRGGGASTVATKHTLDVPELQEAFEATNHRQRDTVTNESNELASTALPPLQGHENYVSSAWNPMRVRTTLRGSGGGGTTTTTSITYPTTSPATLRSVRERQKSQYRQRTRAPIQRPTTSPTLLASKHASPEHVVSVSIEKSHSTSYHQTGTVPPSSTLTTTSNYKNRQHRFQTPTRPPLNKSSTSKELIPKRTTKSVFDTTYFKSPRNDKERDKFHIQSGLAFLPKNHKPY